MLTVFGVAALTFMVLMYGFLAGTSPFGVVEAVRAIVAISRYRMRVA